MVPRRVFFAFLVVALAVGCNGNRCRSYEFECDDGYCVDNDYRCNREDDCYDGSDEDGCSAAVGVAVGLSVFFFVLFCVVIPIAICVLIYCCVAGPLQHMLGGRTVVTTTVNTQAPAPAATTSAMEGVKTDYPPRYVEPMQQYPPQPYATAQAYPPPPYPA